MKRKKVLTLLAAAFVLILLLLSVNALTFSFRLLRFTLSSSLGETKEMDLLAKNCFTNKRLAQSLDDNFLSNDYFLASFMAELISDSKIHLAGKEYERIFDRVHSRFRENIFLAHFGLYEECGPDKDWANFDALALKLLRERRFNPLSFPLLTERMTEGSIPDSRPPLLISYLSWMDNFSLAEDLLAWSREQGHFGEDVRDQLIEDLNRRKRRRPKRKGGPVAGPEQAPLVIPFENEAVKIDADKNLLPSQKARRPGPLRKRWIYSEISDTEQYGKGSFYGDIDPWENNGLRVMGFFTRSLAGFGFARGGLQLKEEIPTAEGTYLFHFRYKTSGQSEIPSFSLSWKIRKTHRLEPADSGWKEVFYIFDNSHYKLDSVQPLLSLFGTGTVWFDDIGFYTIELGDKTVEKDALVIQ